MDGSLSFGDWKKISILGSGAFGVVILFKNNVSNEFIAIKQCKFQTNTSLTKKQKQRWHNEVQIMKSLKNPNIISFKELPKDLNENLQKHNPTQLPLLSMEYCTKGNLRHVLKEPKNICGLEEQQVRCILSDITNGLSYLHSKNITHRDIKPDNIVLQHCELRQSGIVYKIIDLGYAKELNDTVVSFVGTLHYLAPEIFLAEHYNSSVDFWSMGILTFEIICGILPFLPHLTPFERFEKIKDKGRDDICIYLAHSGSVTYSAEIKKEHNISNCLKQNIEVWLRRVLQFEQSNRNQNFPNNVQVLDYLKNVLNKKIVTVFSVCKLEYYSYEINESTLLNTLKDWISRDIKVAKNDLILLVDEEVFGFDDDSLLTDVVRDFSKEIYVFKRENFVNNDISYNFPKLVKEMFKTKINNLLLRQLFAQCIFYINFEKKLLHSFLNSFKLYMKYLRYLTESIREKSMEISQKLSKISTKLECYNNLRVGVDLVGNYEYRECLVHYQRLLSSLDRSILNYGCLLKKIAVLVKRQKKLDEMLPRKEEIIRKCNLQTQYKEAIGILEKSSNKEENNNSLINDLRKIISSLVKDKDLLFRSEQLKKYFKAVGIVVSSCELLLDWMVEFEQHVVDLTQAIDKNQILYHKIRLTAIKPPKKFLENGKEIYELNANDLIQENRNIRYDLSCGMLELNNNLQLYKKLCEEIQSYVP